MIYFWLTLHLISLLLFLLIMGLWHPPIGKRLAAILSSVVSPLVSLERGSVKRKEQWKRFLDSRISRLPNTSTHGKGHLVAELNGDFLLFSGVALGESANLATLVPYAMGTGTGAIHLPISLDIGGLFLFLCLPALLYRLYESVQDTQSKGSQEQTWKKRVIFASFLLALFNSLLLAYYKAEKFALASPDPRAFLTGWLATSDLQSMLFMSTTVLVFICAVFGYRMFLISLQGVAIAATGIGIVLCSIVHAVAKEINGAVNRLCYWLSRGKFSPYMEIPKPTTQLPRPQLEVFVSEEEIPPHQIPESSTEKELAAMKSNKTAAMIVDSVLGAESHPFVKDGALQKDAIQYINASGSNNPMTPQPLVLPDTVNITPSQTDLATASLPGRTHEQVQTALFERTGQRLVNSYSSGNTSVNLSLKPIFAVISNVNIRYTEDMFAKISTLRNRSIVLATTLTLEDLQNSDVQEGFKLLINLWQKRKITGTIVFDPTKQCPYVKNNGRRALLKFVASCIIDPIIAPYHYGYNPDSLQMFEHLFSRSGFATMSLASDSVSAGVLPTRHKVFNLFPGEKIATGVGNIQNVTDTLIPLIDATITKPEKTFALDAPFASDSESVFLIEIPSYNPDWLHEAGEEISYQVDKQVHDAKTAIISANGTRSVTQFRDSYYVQVCHLWSLSERWFGEILPPGKVIKGTLTAKELPVAADTSSNPQQPSQTGTEKHNDRPQPAPQPVQAEKLAKEKMIGNPAGVNGSAPKRKPGRQPKNKGGDK